MTDWTKPQKKSKVKYIIIPIIIVGIAVFFLAFDVTPNEAMGKKLTDIQNLDEIHSLQETIELQYQDISLMIQNGTDSNIIKDFTKDVTKNINDLDKLVGDKKKDFEKYKIEKEQWEVKRFSDKSVIQQEIDCPTHPMRPGHFVLDPNEIDNAIYDRCFATP